MSFAWSELTKSTIIHNTVRLSLTPSAYIIIIVKNRLSPHIRGEIEELVMDNKKDLKFLKENFDNLNEEVGKLKTGTDS